MLIIIIHPRRPLLQAPPAGVVRSIPPAPSSSSSIKLCPVGCALARAENVFFGIVTMANEYSARPFLALHQLKRDTTHVFGTGYYGMRHVFGTGHLINYAEKSNSADTVYLC
ncbi:hypothetical protein niasHT_025415 [Heterodera trifolii]|uniref:Uncharacterized protein n=1 Tax=Heterodera trifolii TaxID=157864 RepID=A0ABD2KER9_9BILA